MAIRFPLVTPLGFQILMDRLDPVLKTLNYREREVIRLLYGMLCFDECEYTFEEIATIFKLSTVQIRRIETNAVRKLRTPKRLKMLADFFDTASRLKTPEGFHGFINRVLGV